QHLTPRGIIRGGKTPEKKPSPGLPEKWPDRRAAYGEGRTPGCGRVPGLVTTGADAALVTRSGCRCQGTGRRAVATLRGPQPGRKRRRLPRVAGTLGTQRRSTLEAHRVNNVPGARVRTPASGSGRGQRGAHLAGWERPTSAGTGTASRLMPRSASTTKTTGLPSTSRRSTRPCRVPARRSRTRRYAAANVSAAP